MPPIKLIMKLFIFGTLLLANGIIASPVTNNLRIIPGTLNSKRANDQFYDPKCYMYCGGIVNEQNLPPVAEVLELANQLKARGTELCSITRPQGSTKRTYTTIARSANAEVTIWFNERYPNVYHAAYECQALGDYVAKIAKMPTEEDPFGCQTKYGTVVGSHDVTTCFHKELLYTGDPPLDAPGLRIDVVIPDWHKFYIQENPS
ncbi:hypothetical protein CC78DRAFT_532390 [Lojkania enalia]|uniref:Uncharacterized protein n=1 Tax=Lojkania enalia TaxID=147567 RepID=A0A9P4KBH8_9PLEO|nr:hypothetical protein CC78DRAFT_532390 [Didymosphaeria enalia]